MVTREDSSMLVAVESDSSQNSASAINKDTSLKGGDDEEIKMPEVMAGDQGDTFL